MKVLLLLILLGVYTEGAKILGIFNHPGTSHTYAGEYLLKKLVERGHEVTRMTAFPSKEESTNFKHIYLPNILEDLERRNKNNNSKSMGYQELKEMTYQHTEQTFKAVGVRKLLNSNEKFDLIIIDWFYNEATLIFGYIYKAPVIYISTFGNMALLNEFTGNTLPLSYVPGAGLYASDKMTLQQRLTMALINFGYDFLFVPRRNNAYFELLNRYFVNPPSIEELKENVALVLANSHYSFETPRPNTPNVIPIGGFHVREPKELQIDLKNFLDEASDGVIFFSLGTQRAAFNLQNEQLMQIFKALGKLPQKVIMKHSDTSFSYKPDNVKIVKWAPQVEILAHPNVKLFVTHAGLFSFIESIYYQVPMVCIPFAGDQITNAAFSESRKIGVHLASENITAHTLYKAIQEVLNNPRYKKEVEFRSTLLRNQPIKPLDAATYWVEHVLHYGHGKHLKPFATKLPWYQYYMIDVIGVILGTISAVLFVMFKLVQRILCGVQGKKVKNE